MVHCVLGVFPFYNESADGSEGNPFGKKINMFNLSAFLAKDYEQVKFDKLVPLVQKFCPGRCATEVSREFQNFASWAMRPNACDRPSCIQLLGHPWITTNTGKVNLKEWLQANDFIASKSVTATPSLSPTSNPSHGRTSSSSSS
jgi:hypothetical protein